MKIMDILPNKGKRVSVRNSKNVFVIYGLSAKGKALLLYEGEEDHILNRYAVNVSDVKLIKEEQGK